MDALGSLQPTVLYQHTHEYEDNQCKCANLFFFGLHSRPTLLKVCNCSEYCPTPLLKAWHRTEAKATKQLNVTFKKKKSTKIRKW